MKNPIAPLLASLAILPALLSCDARSPSAVEQEDRVGICPRFAAGDTVPVVDLVKARLRASNGFDTTIVARYAPRGPLVLGTLPSGVAFTISMIGCDTVGAAGADTVNVWWTSASDSTTGNLYQRTIDLPRIQRPETPAPSVSGSFYVASWIHFGPGTYYTTDRSDPRSSPSRLLAVDSIRIDSAWATVQAAVFSPADSSHPDLWSEVATFPVALDPLDTTTGLDSLAVYYGSRHTFLEALSRADHVFGKDSLEPLIQIARKIDSCFIKIKPTSPRATVTFRGVAIRSDDTVYVGSLDPSLPIPALAFEIRVENHGRVGLYKPTIQSSLIPSSTQQSLASISVTPGALVRRNDTVFAVQDLDAAVETLLVSVTRFVGSDSTIVRIRDSLVGLGSFLSVPIRSDVDSILIQSSATADAPRRTYRINVYRKTAAFDTLGFLDTTWSTPWRAVPYDTLTDSRDGKTYRTIVVGSARWMAENLNYRVDSSWCPASNADSCKKYGRLYTWSAAMDTTSHFDSTTFAPAASRRGICPEGWHVPNNAEWAALFAAIPSTRPASLMKAAGPVWSDSAGLDSLGFRAMPAGKRVRYTTSPYVGQTERNLAVQFWTATESTTAPTKASSWRFTSAPSPTRSEYEKTEGHSVRCVSDTAVVAP